MSNGSIEYHWQTVIEDVKQTIAANRACVDERRADGGTVFHVVAEHSNIMDGRILQHLIEINPKGVEVANKYGLLPLHKAVMHHDTDVEELEILIDAFPGALCAQTIEGQCPLHLAVTGTKASAATVTFLICSAPEAAQIVDKYGHYPLHKACSRSAPVFLSQRLPS